jgi:hypothetical protein
MKLIALAISQSIDVIRWDDDLYGSVLFMIELVIDCSEDMNVGQR